jgi:hypothetical protein
MFVGNNSHSLESRILDLKTQRFFHTLTQLVRFAIILILQGWGVQNLSNKLIDIHLKIGILNNLVNSIYALHDSELNKSL